MCVTVSECVLKALYGGFESAEVLLTVKYVPLMSLKMIIICQDVIVHTRGLVFKPGKIDHFDVQKQAQIIGDHQKLFMPVYNLVVHRISMILLIGTSSLL